MRVLVTGGTGYIGNALVEAFCRAGHPVVATFRDAKKSWKIERFGGRAVHWDIRDHRSLSPEIRETDVLVHAAMEMGADGGKLDQDCVTVFLDELSRSAGLRRFVYTSGVWVLGNTRENPPQDNTIPAVSPPHVAWRPPVERMVLESAGCGITPMVIRPGIVYGGAGGITGFLMGMASAGTGVVIVGEGDNHWSPVHRDDLADLYLRAAERGPAGTIFNGTDGSCPTVGATAQSLSLALGFGGKITRTPPDEGRQKWGGLADGLLLDQCVSGDFAERLLGWCPRHRSIVSEASALVRSWKALSEPRP